MSKPSANQRYTGARKLAGLRPEGPFRAQFGLAISLDESWDDPTSRPVTLVECVINRSAEQAPPSPSTRRVRVQVPQAPRLA